LDVKQESAHLILKLYELRREEKLREARQWYFRDFNPETTKDLMMLMQNEQHSAYFRMLTSYWDMAASLVNHGAIDAEMFTDANLEHLGVFAKVQPFVAEMRQTLNAPYYLAQLEKLVMSQPDGAERVEQMRARQKQMAAMRQQAQAASAGEKAS